MFIAMTWMRWAWLSLFLVPQALGEGDAHKSEDKPKEEKKKEPKPEQDDPNQTIMKFEPMSVPVVRYDEVIGYVYVKFEMESNNHETFRVLNKIKPRFRDAVLRNLYGYFAISWNAHDPVNIIGLRKYILDICEQVSGPGMIKGVKLNLVYSTPMKHKKSRPKVIKP